MDFDNDNYESHNFTIRFDSNDGNRSLEMNFSELFLDDILNQMRDFLRGCGYEIDGQIAVVPWEQEDPEDPKQYQKEFSFENIPNNNWPFSASMSDTIPALTTKDIVSLSTEPVTFAMPGTAGSATYDLRFGSPNGA
jgi:hypothetical protein